MSAALHAEVLAGLRRAGCPVTTTDLMKLLNQHRQRPLVREPVYDALNALRARGVVHALRAIANKRIRYWQLTPAAMPMSDSLDHPPAPAPGRDQT